MNIVGHLSIPYIFFFSRKRLNELAQGLGPYPADLETSQSFIDGKRVYAANNLLKPIYVLMSRWISRFFCNLNSSKNFTCLSGKLITEFASPIAKFTSPGLSDITFFARCNPSTQDSQNTTLGTRYFTGAFSSGPRSVSLRPTLQTSRSTPVELPLPSPPLMPTKVTFISQCLASLRTQTYFYSSLPSTRKVTLSYFSGAWRKATTGKTFLSAG